MADDEEGASPYPKSIWRERSQYRIAHLSLSASEFEAIFRLTSVEAAKKRIPPIAPGDLLRIARLVWSLPPARLATSKHIKDYPLEGKCGGAGIATLICMLAVESKGDYSPIDHKFATACEQEKRSPIVKSKP